VRAVNGSTLYQKDGVEANFASGSPLVLTMHAVQLIGSCESAPGMVSL